MDNTTKKVLQFLASAVNRDGKGLTQDIETVLNNIACGDFSDFEEDSDG